MQRREYLTAVGNVGIASAFAGCSGDDSGGDDTGGSDAAATVAVGPGGNFAFDPERVTVSVGETVEWTFESPSHNVAFDPSFHSAVSIPDGVEGFASVDTASAVNDEGASWSHTFETAGSYHYVCVPHASVGMQGDVVVEE